MKKNLTAVAMAALMVMGLAACGNSSTTSTTAGTTAGATTAAAKEETSKAAEGTSTAAGAETTGAASTGEKHAGDGSEIEGFDSSMLVDKAVNLTTLSQGAGTDDYITTAAETKLFQEKLPSGSKITQETISSGCSSVGYLIENDMGDFGTGQNAMSATVGMEGHDPYKSIDALMSTKKYAFVAELATKEFVDKTGYSTLDEVLTNKVPCRFVAEPIGSSDYVSFMYLLDVHGVTQEDIESWGGSVTFTDGSACCDMLQDGQADMMVGHTVSTSSSLTELCMSADMVVSGLTDEEIKGMCAKGYAESTIPVGSFGQTTEEMKSACQASSKVVSADMDDKLAYTLTKIMVENSDKLGEDEAGFRDITFEEMVDTNAMVVPMHPGAKKYFQDIGVLDADGKYTGKKR